MLELGLPEYQGPHQEQQGGPQEQQGLQEPQLRLQQDDQGQQQEQSPNVASISTMVSADNPLKAGQSAGSISVACQTDDEELTCKSCGGPPFFVKVLKLIFAWYFLNYILFNMLL